MDANRFAAIVEAYGADPRRWPEAERAGAEAFAERPEAVALLREARALDAMLDVSDAADPVNLSFTRRILAVAPKPQVSVWRPAAAMAACALLGLAFGFNGAQGVREANAAAAALEFALSDGGIG